MARDGEAPAAAADDGEGRRAGLSPGAAADKREAREEEPVPVAPEKRHAITTRRSQRGEETEEEAREWRRESAAASDAEMHERDAQKENVEYMPEKLAMLKEMAAENTRELRENDEDIVNDEVIVALERRQATTNRLSLCVTQKFTREDQEENVEYMQERSAMLREMAAENERELREDDQVIVALEKRQAITKRLSQHVEETEEEARELRKRSVVVSNAEIHERDSHKENVDHIEGRLAMLREMAAENKRELREDDQVIVALEKRQARMNMLSQRVDKTYEGAKEF